MSGATPARRAALALLSECRRRDGRVRDIARGFTALASLSPEDRALAMRIATGVTSAASVLDELIDSHVSHPGKVEPRVRDALRAASFELLYLSTPKAVAASQGVELVRGVRPKAAGMANAVLRRIASDDAPRVAGARSECAGGACADAGVLSLASGIPAWLCDRIVQDRGAKAACTLALAQLDPAPVWVGANEARIPSCDLPAILEDNGLRPEETDVPGAYLLGSPAGLVSSGLVGNADLVVADLSAQRVCQTLSPAPGSRVLEIGQGRGTKSVLLQSAALRSGGYAQVVGVDSVDSKVSLARRRMGAAGLSGHVSSVCMDARLLGSKEGSEDIPEVVSGTFDLVFLDAPCSGTGTMRRHPEIPSRLDQGGVRELSRLQLELLRAASARVAPGGTLAYATCSVLSEEDEGVVTAFLCSEQGKGFAVDEGRGFLSCPAPGGPDGHYLCVMRRARVAIRGYAPSG